MYMYNYTYNFMRHTEERCVYIQACIYVHVYIYIYVHACVYIYMCIYMFHPQSQKPQFTTPNLNLEQSSSRLKMLAPLTNESDLPTS